MRWSTVFRASMLFLAVAIAPWASGQTIINGSASDFEPRLRTGGTITTAGPYDPGPSITATSLRVGFQTNFQITSAYYFKLPVLAPGESINSAHFSTSELIDSAVTAATPGFNADLIAIGFTNFDPPNNSADESRAYYFVGQVPPGPSLIQDNFLVPADFIPDIPPAPSSALKGTDSRGDAALLSFINSLYAGMPDNDFLPGTSSLILRLNPDITSSAGTVRYTVASAETTGAPLPKLALNVVPEPGAMALLAGMGCLLLVRRRQNPA
jgi:hypothetical protein